MPKDHTHIQILFPSIKSGFDNEAQDLPNPHSLPYSRRAGFLSAGSETSLSFLSSLSVSCLCVFFFYYYAKRKFPSRVSCPVRGGASRKLRSCLSPLSVAFWSDATPQSMNTFIRHPRVVAMRKLVGKSSIHSFGIEYM